MAERPFLFFPSPTAVPKAPLGGGGGTYRKPSPAQQKQRLESRFKQIADSFQTLQSTVEGTDPEQVIVLETLTESVEDVAGAASKIPGLEWLADIDLAETDAIDGFEDAKNPSKKISHRLYALFTNQEAMDSLLSLWDAWLQEPDKRAARGFGPFKKLFLNLADIRRWGPADRIFETGILDAWREDVQVKGLQGSSRFEVELWCRSDPTKRAQLVQGVLGQIQNVGGREISRCFVEEIRYHALLVEVPSAYVQELLAQLAQQQYVQLLLAEGVMFFRPQGQASFRLGQPEPLTFDLASRIANAVPALGKPVAALLDGTPLANHIALAGRVILDDPDGHGALYQAGQQFHGTAMASTVLFGDLNGTSDAVPQPLYVRPILQPDTFHHAEVTPPEELLVDLIHRAIRRLFEQEGGTAPVAPTVKIVNLSIGDRSRPFDRELSPLAKLLDWLAWKYRLLFIVSAGNCISDLSVNLSPDQWDGLSPQDRKLEILRAMQLDQFRRRPLSPAEAINAITVSASHRDECPSFEIGTRVDVIDNMGGPSPLTTVASGYRRSIKPDFLLPGGRQLYLRPAPENPTMTFVPSTAINAPGHLSAAPGLLPMEITRVGYSCGTSNATALATRYASMALHQLQQSENYAELEDYCAVVLKALLVHGASWGEASAYLDKAFGLESVDWREAVKVKRQFLGYGEVSPQRCLTATDQRVTIIGWGEIGVDEGLVFSMPLPPSLSAVTEYRKFTTTLAWLTSCNQRHKNYRRAHLYLSVPSNTIGTNTIGVDAKTAQRGTVEHRVFEGTDAKAYLDGAAMAIQVNCKADAGKLEDNIPFALIVSLEVEATSTIAVYNEVEARIRGQIEVTAT